ncbi:hypothetical protein GCM10027589_31030 [Actinocorallia lasiicapitis]
MNSSFARRFVTPLRAHFAKLRAVADRGATAVEYALLVALIAVAIIGATAALGGSIVDMLNGANDGLDCATPAGGAPPAGCVAP